MCLAVWSPVSASGRRSGVRCRQRSIIRDLYWLRPRREIRFAGRHRQRRLRMSMPWQATTQRVGPVWGLDGRRRTRRLNRKDGSIVYRFHARDLHLVLGSRGKRQCRFGFRVTIDGMPPGDNHGADVDAGGQGVVNGQRLYQLVRQNGAITDHTFEIRFLDPGVRGLCFHLWLKNVKFLSRSAA